MRFLKEFLAGLLLRYQKQALPPIPRDGDERGYGPSLSIRDYDRMNRLLTDRQNLKAAMAYKAYVAKAVPRNWRDQPIEEKKSD